MIDQQHIAVIIPALNEQASIGRVISEIPSYVDRIIVVDNDSIDATKEVSENAGAVVVDEPKRGYGKACLTGIAAAGDSDVIAFINGSYSDYPQDLDKLIRPVVSGSCDLAIGCRQDDPLAPGGRFAHQKLGTQMVCLAIRVLHGYRFEDLGPLRCISHRVLRELQMEDEDFGWTVEMQLKAAKSGKTVLQIPVQYRKRVGQSKISGTLRGSLMAGCKMFYWVFRLL
ncbi:MAG: glycosyltransferase family 2 protein [Acidiferrobacterales bacterium]|nr:glycosyltransferase family 2 protein [Acidiferrobacterales bacterium]